AAEAYRGEHARKHVACLVMHERDRTRQFPRRRAAVAGARIDEDPGAGRCRELLGKIAPARNAAEPLVQQHQRRPGIRARADHAVFEPPLPGLEHALISQRHYLPPSAYLATMRASFAQLCSTVSPEVSSWAWARA